MAVGSSSASGGRVVPERPETLAIEALGSLYREHIGEMQGLARRLLAEEQLPESTLSAEDVVHTAFAKVLRAPEQIRDLRAYLYAVIRSDVRTASRQNRRRTILAAVPACEAQSADVRVADFSDLVANRVTVYRALSDLPTQQRTAVWATKALGYTHAETAEAMKKRPGTVATHVVRAVAALQICLATLLVVGFVALSLAGSRLLKRVQPPADSPQDPLPQAPSASTWIYVAVGCLLVSGLVRWAFRLWTRRREAIKEGGTFAPRPVVGRIRESFRDLRYNSSVFRKSQRRTAVLEDDLPEYGGVVRTRTRLPETRELHTHVEPRAHPGHMSMGNDVDR
ncbi:RNA polymerase sigma factor [Streptomyces sp. 150FB]|uniref:RNA polymerase sigma factor n=1 Tax=Streptomyces sp. 150FB TaxID=1576605 RepID=UPI001364C144|nr:RNA polymerase sigma factor [Streptomyces sp. 150FB]